MFNRKILSQLKAWKDSTVRKPLILRGARQTGKTTLVRQLGALFDNFVELNLEKTAHQKVFSEIKDAKELVKSIESVTGKTIISGQTLLFIDEIQNSSSAIKNLRYFYEELPGLHVVVTGSLLEMRMQQEGWSFPVGRVEFLYLYPVTFEEFLQALGKDVLVNELSTVDGKQPLPSATHETLLNLLAEYLIVGGMPEAVANYIKTESFVTVKKIQQDIQATYFEDFFKYAKGTETYYLKLLWEKIPFTLGQRIKYSELSDHPTKAKNIVIAFEILHAAMLAERIFPTTDHKLPIAKKDKAAPKVFPLDIGLSTQALGLTKDQLREHLIKDTCAGGLMEAFVHQELLATDSQKRNPYFFWIREEKDALAETDFLYVHQNQVLPIEVKSGSSGSLKSLHQYLYRNKKSVGVRLSSGNILINDAKVAMQTGEVLTYRLYSLPLYLASRLEQVID